MHEAMTLVRIALLVVFALPVAQLFWLARYADTKDTAGAKATTVFTFIPFLVLTTILWAWGWMLLLNNAL